MIKAIIVDDERKSIISLKWELSNFSKEINIKESFTDPVKAIEYINSHQIDCLFLDIEMPEMDGFQFLKHFPKRSFCVVFVTAYDGYAIDAIKEQAFDYLLKPVDSDDLKLTLSKIKAKMKAYDRPAFSGFTSDNTSKISLTIDGKIRLFTPDEILYCKSEGNYCHIFLSNGNHHLLTKKLKDVESNLNESFFYRVHHSYNVNLRQVKSFDKNNSKLILNKNIEIPVSRSKKNTVKERLLNG